MMTGLVFGLLTVAHVWRMLVETDMARNPWYILITLAAAALCLWACRLLWRAGRPSSS
jgi:hypothetical protein